MKIVLPFGAGGVADVTSRIMADKLDKILGQRVVIENMPGPGGINAARAVINAPPDGYTLGLVTNGTAISVAAFNHLPFDPVNQFAMISELGSSTCCSRSTPTPNTRRWKISSRTPRPIRASSISAPSRSAARKISAPNCSSRRPT